MKTLYSIVGMQHRPGAEALLSTAMRGDSLSLRRDRNNQYDRNAVEVWLNDFHIGFIKGSEVAPVAREMDQRGIDTLPAILTFDGSRWPSAQIDLEV